MTRRIIKMQKNQLCVLEKCINKVTLDNGDTKWYNKYTKVKKGNDIMTKEIKIALLEERLNKLRNSSKDNDGVQRKLERQLRNLRK